MKKHIFFVVLALSTVLAVTAAGAHDRDEEDREEFYFGNHIDTHQTSFLKENGTLKGTFNITFTGELDENGIPIAKHCDSNTLPKDCITGWKLRGIPGEATFVYQNMDHPVWYVNSREDIPQPGAYAHFHWITMDSNDTRVVDDVRCNVNQASMLQRGAYCPGYFLQFHAVRTFVFSHGNDRILIKKGLDIGSHINIITSTDPSAALLD